MKSPRENQMNTQNAKMRRCPSCREADLLPATYVREFHPHGKNVAVELLTSRCPACGAEATSTTQHTENLARLKARKAEYRGLLLGEEILALRRRYGITQQVAAKIFGKGKIAFSRYENETSYPDDSTAKLLKLAIQKPDVIKSLADDESVELPLWNARCEDERGVKLRVIFEGIPDSLARRWAEKELGGSTGRATHDDLLWPFANREGGEEMTSISANDEHYFSEAAYG